MKIKLELNQTQADILQDALDLYSRILTGQFDEIDHLMRFEVGTNAEWKTTRKLLEELQELYYPELGGRAAHSIGSPKTPDKSKIAYDMIQVIRYVLAPYKHSEGGYSVDFSPPLQYGCQELVKCEVEVEDRLMI